MGLIDWLFGEEEVALPARVSDMAIATGCSFIRDSLRAAQVKASAEQARQNQLENDDRMFKSDQSSVVLREGSPTIRYHTSIPVESICSGLRSSMAEEISFGRMLQRLVGEKCGGRAAQCYRRAGISRQVYARIVSGQSGVARETVLRLALGLRLSYGEAQDFLECAGYTFRSTEVFDAVFDYCLRHEIYNIFDVNEILVALGEQPLTIY